MYITCSFHASHASYNRYSNLYDLYITNIHKILSQINKYIYKEEAYHWKIDTYLR